MIFDPDHHHRRSIRLPGYDYARNGTYFVTICLQGRECLFGGIANGEMEMNEAGLMVADAWLALPERFPSILVDEFVIMPNHFHGIILITNNNDDGFGLGRGAACRAQNACRAPIIGTCGKGAASSAPTVGKIMRAFKSISAIAVNRALDRHGVPVWQRNYYERIIRDDNELQRARQYILDNPAKWDQYHENPANKNDTAAICAITTRHNMTADKICTQNDEPT